jgi:hypothetical protein
MAAQDSDSSGTRERYGRLIEGVLRPAVAAARVGGAEGEVVAVERGVALAAAVLGEGAGVVRRIVGAAPGRLVVSDRGGHRRPVYRGLLLYGVLQAMRVARVEGGDVIGRSDVQGVNPHPCPLAEYRATGGDCASGWLGLLEAELAGAGWPAGADGDCVPASAGAAVAELAWLAMAARAGGMLAAGGGGPEVAGVIFHEIARRQAPCGAFVMAGRGDNLDTVWYHELVILHAVASYAVQAGDETLKSAAARGAAHVQEELQPDHATNDPWGLPGFLLCAETLPLADQVLHAATALQGAVGRGGVSGVTSLLLADALYCLEVGG